VKGDHWPEERETEREKRVGRGRMKDRRPAGRWRCRR